MSYIDKSYLSNQFKNFARFIGEKFAKKTDIPTKLSDLDDDKDYVVDGDYQHITIDDKLNPSSNNAISNKAAAKEINYISRSCNRALAGLELLQSEYFPFICYDSYDTEEKSITASVSDFNEGNSFYVQFNDDTPFSQDRAPQNVYLNFNDEDKIRVDGYTKNYCKYFRGGNIIRFLYTNKTLVVLDYKANKNCIEKEIPYTIEINGHNADSYDDSIHSEFDTANETMINIFEDLYHNDMILDDKIQNKADELAKNDVYFVTCNTLQNKKDKVVNCEDVKELKVGTQLFITFNTDSIISGCGENSEGYKIPNIVNDINETDDLDTKEEKRIFENSNAEIDNLRLRNTDETDIEVGRLTLSVNGSEPKEIKFINDVVMGVKQKDESNTEYVTSTRNLYNSKLYTYCTRKMFYLVYTGDSWIILNYYQGDTEFRLDFITESFSNLVSKIQDGTIGEIIGSSPTNSTKEYLINCDTPQNLMNKVATCEEVITLEDGMKVLVKFTANREDNIYREDERPTGCFSGIPVTDDLETNHEEFAREIEYVNDFWTRKGDDWNIVNGEKVITNPCTPSTITSIEVGALTFNLNNLGAKYIVPVIPIDYPIYDTSHEAGMTSRKIEGQKLIYNSFFYKSFCNGEIYEMIYHDNVWYLLTPIDKIIDLKASYLDFQIKEMINKLFMSLEEEFPEYINELVMEELEKKLTEITPKILEKNLENPLTIDGKDIDNIPDALVAIVNKLNELSQTNQHLYWNNGQ